MPSLMKHHAAVPSSVYIYSTAGDGAFLGPLLRAEGVATTLYTVAPEARDVLRGYVPRQTVADVPKDALVVFDDVGHGRLGSLFRGRGHPVIGGNPIDRAWEIDRLHGARMAERAGITVPETASFPTIRQAIRFLEGQDGEWFVKPSGNPLASCALTQSGEVPHLVRHLQWAQRQVASDFPALVLQRAVEGLEIDCNGYFDGEDFVPPFFSTLEDKRLMDGDRGPRTGCACNVVWPWHPGARLPEETVMLVAPVLRAAGYVGDVALNMILDSAGVPNFLEWSLRWGFDALHAFVALLDTDTMPLHEQLHRFATRQLDEWVLRPDVALSLTTRVSVPPYPTHDLKALAEAKGSPLDERLDGSHPRLFSFDVMKGLDGKPALAGASGIVCTVGATGTDMADCRARVRELAESLAVDDAQFRSDLIPRYETAIATLRDMGYLAGDEDEEVADARTAHSA